MITYETIILWSWAAFLLVWSVTALDAKKDVRGGGITSALSQHALLRLIAAAAVIFVAVRIATGTTHYASPIQGFSRTLFTPPSLLGWTAAALAVIGVTFAIWARFHLGRNWSSRPAVKEGHELVTSGPYAYVRHPIYTGVILMTLGTAFTGAIFGIAVFIIFLTIFLSRINKEERIMLELFPNEYPAYQVRTKRLAPFVW